MINVEWNPSARVLRQFAAAAVFILSSMAAVAHLRGRSGAASALPLVLAAGLAIAALVRPLILRVPYVLLTLVVFPIGSVVSHLILIALFYGVITPLGLLARAAGSDPLSERRGRAASSYWRKRPPPRDAASYVRQA
jgi:hypothetical protein